MKSVFVVWKDIEDGMWHPVAKLTRDGSLYRFNYTKGANHKNFIPFPRMNDKSKVYVSTELFSFFQNRLLPKNRPEFKKILAWSNISTNHYDELDVLSITGGARQTDEYRVVGQPTLSKSGEYSIRFFINGIRHLEKESTQAISQLIAGDQLKFEVEGDNMFDCNAVLATTTCERKTKVGYCPKYFNCDVKLLLSNPSLKHYELRVVQVNHDAPPQYRLLCNFTTKWPKDFVPLLSEDYLAHTVQESVIEF